MGYYLTKEQVNDILEQLRGTTKVCAPKAITRRGRGKGKPEIRYGEIRDFSEIVFDQKADYGPKEIIYPVMQTLLKFAVTEVIVSELEDERDILILARPCDINAIRRLDQIFLKNGGNPEYYYARLREKAKFILLECTQSFETCFCVSMGSNIATDYAAAVRFDPEGMLVEVKDESLLPVFSCGEERDFEPEFVKENLRTVQVPDIPDRSYLSDIIGLEYWAQFTDRCILCGGCNTVCPTCTCFDTNDIIYNESSLEGERRRTWSSCMLSTYTVMAGGHGVREDAGANTRFKTLHKIYDYKERFGEENMCVGCGRCDMRCPKEIKFSETIGGLAQEVELLKQKRAEEAKEDA
ncbi:MAG: anaerobic sulfite reductase subunit AsrA [Lachnospiraceae bacterium]|nr:anaerobic sulfite reductase subunit AsrA [Lachnospiraceae bacterium]